MNFIKIARLFIHLLFFIFLLSFFIFFANCEKDFSGLHKGNVAPAPDTTSHNFSWTVEHVGDLTSSLSDVFAISENDIWAVGEIHVEDSSGNETMYNAVHWDGQNWEVNRIPTNSVIGIGYYRINAVHGFNTNNVWMFSNAGSYSNLSGTQWTTELVAERQGGINKIWGNKPNNIFFVGTNGNVTNFTGVVWQKQESNTTTILRDVWGNSDGSAVWACGYASNNSESVLLRYNGSQWQTVWNWQSQQCAYDSSYVGLLSSLWAFSEDSLIIVSGDGVFRQDMFGNSPPRVESFNPEVFPTCVRGSSANNIFICGDSGRIWQFNGSTWKTFPELHDNRLVFRSITVLENTVVAVGADFSQTIQRDIIVTGIRQ